MKLALLFQSRARYGILAAVFLGLLGISQPKALAQRSFFRFTPIADTQPQFPYANLTLFPCQNTEDRVAFDATLTGGVQGMFSRRDLGGIDTIADTGSTPYESIADCSINANGLVLFSALQQLPNEFAQVLLLGGGGNPLLSLLTAKADGTYDNFGAYQLNAQGKAVTIANKSDGSGSVILTNGPLTGITKIIADTSKPNSPFVSLGSPSINGNNTVAFTAGRRDGTFAIITIADDGTVTSLIDNTGPFAGFDDIDLNDNGSLAFDGHQQGGLGGVWRIDTNGSSTSITKITDENATGPSEFTAVSLNDSGQVAYAFLDAISQTTSTVGMGNGGRRFIFGPGPIVAGPGSMVLGHPVASAHISRDALNNLGQLVLEIEFWDRAPMIARAEVVNPWQNIVASVGAIALTTGNGSGTGTHTVVTLPPHLLLLNFDATFLTNKGELKILLGDRLLKSILAGSRGMRQSFQVPIDLREKTRRTTPIKPQDVTFQLTGAPGALVHIGNIRLPGTRLSSTQTDAIQRWHFDTKGEGWAGFVDDTPFPVEIKLLAEKQEQSAPAKEVKEVSVAILSTKTFDATKDIERDTLHFDGTPVAQKAESNGGNRPRCSERDVNGDGVPDLVCEFENPAAKAVGSSPKTALLHGMTPYGWVIEGRAD